MSIFMTVVGTIAKVKTDIFLGLDLISTSRLLGYQCIIQHGRSLGQLCDV